MITVTVVYSQFVSKRSLTTSRPGAHCSHLRETRTCESCMSLLEPGNALPLQTEVFEAWPRRELAPICVHSGDTPQRRQMASFYNILGDGGSMTRRSYELLAVSWQP
jgi:hypothetical protein